MTYDELVKVAAGAMWAPHFQQLTGMTFDERLEKCPEMVDNWMDSGDRAVRAVIEHLAQEAEAQGLTTITVFDRLGDYDHDENTADWLRSHIPEDQR